MRQSGREVVLHRAPRWMIGLILVVFTSMAVWSSIEEPATIIYLVPLDALMALVLCTWAWRLGVYVGSHHIRVTGLIDRTVPIADISEVRVGYHRGIGPIRIVTDARIVEYRNGPAIWSPNRQKLIRQLRWVRDQGIGGRDVDLDALTELTSSGFFDSEQPTPDS